jgi:hypothetical protein
MGIGDVKRYLDAKILPLWTGLQVTCLHQPICNHLQRQNYPVESKDPLDDLSPIYGYTEDYATLYVG